MRRKENGIARLISSLYKPQSSPMKTYVAHIGGEAVLAFRAEDDDQAQEMIQNHEGLRSDLRVLVERKRKAAMGWEIRN